jgi:hypothetical protein
MSPGRYEDRCAARHEDLAADIEAKGSMKHDCMTKALETRNAGLADMS